MNQRLLWADDKSALIVHTRTGKPNTATNLEYRMATIFRNADLADLKGDYTYSGEHLRLECMRLVREKKKLHHESR